MLPDEAAAVALTSHEGNAPASVPLTLAPRELAPLMGGTAPPYRQVYNRTIDGTLPARRINGRWYFNRSDLPEIAKILSARAPAESRASGRPEASAAAIAA